MGKLDKILNKVGLVRATERSAGFMELETGKQGLLGGKVESEKITDYKDFIDTFRKLPWLYAGATALAIAASRPKLRIYQEIKKGDKTKQIEIAGEDINRLIKRPNPFLSYRELIQITVINMVLLGNHFWNLVGTKEKQIISPGNQPVEIWWIKPEQIEIKTSKEKFIDSYIYKSQGNEVPIDPSEIIHFKAANPDSYFRGLGAVEPIADTSIMELNAINYNKRFLGNDATPAGLITSPDALSKEQRDKHRRSWNEAHQGSGKAGKIGYMWGGMDFKEIGKTPKDASYIEMRKMNRVETLAVLGVPPSIVGLLEYANYSNMEVQEKKLWEGAVMPMLGLVSDKLTLSLAPLFNEEYYFEFDYSKIQALQTDEKKKADTAHILVTDGVMTRNEIRDKFYNLEPLDGLDKIYLPISLIPISEIGGSEASNEDEDKAIRTGKEPSFWQDKTRKKVLWNNFVKRIKAKEKPVISKIEQFLRGQAESAAAAIRKAKTTGDVVAERIFNEEKEIDRYEAKFAQFYEDMFMSAGQAGMKISKGLLYDPDVERVFKDGDGEPLFTYTDELREKIMHMVVNSGTKINATTMKKIAEMIELAANEEWTVEQMAQNIHEKLSGLAVGRSRVIARTETAKVENMGQLEGYKQSEFIELKGWLCSFVPESRESHMAADAEYSDNPIPLNEPFIVDGEELQYPGDPTGGSAGNVIHCLCSTYPEVGKI